ncbi:MAG TPA: DUF4235 domain-containing protein [Solirubrobacteraceae bacterium]|jgi:hypothetical protein
MNKVAFTPFSVGAGLVAGLIAKRTFARIWGLIDDEEAPKPEHRDVALGKLLLAVAIEGTIFSLVKGLVDHGSRHAFLRLTGTWPGDERPEAK